jgi:hypothetical protein
LTLRGHSDTEEDVLEVQVGEESCIFWDEAEEGIWVGHQWMEGNCGFVDYSEVLDRPVVICPRLFDW